MGHWNYRVFKRKVGDETVYAIHEAYYDDDDETKIGYTQDPIHAEGETIEDLRWELTEMLKALEKPVLEYDDESTDKSVGV